MENTNLVQNNQESFGTIIVIVLLAIAVFYLVSSSNSNFTNNRPIPRQQNKGLRPRVANKPLRENLANIDDPSTLPTTNPGNDLPSNPGTQQSAPSSIPTSVVQSAELNKQFPTGTFKPLLLTPSGEVSGSSADTSNAGVGIDYTLGVDQNLANPSGRQMQTSDDLRPQEMNSGWFNSPYDRTSQLQIENGNLLASASSQAKIGIDTIGQSLRNASYDIRGSIPIPKFDIGPFNNSTIEYDYNIKALY